MSHPAEDIAAVVQARGFALAVEVREAARLAEETRSPILHAMVGDLIQLLDDDSEYDLGDAEAAYLRAIGIDPAYAEGYTSLGHFYDAMHADPQRARSYFEKAVALGDTAAEEDLRSVLARRPLPMTPTAEIDALFELSLTAFTAARNSLAARLKKEGRAGEAERVKAMPKPPATAWAVNQLFWRHPSEVERLLAIGEKVREAQTGSAAELRALLEERRTVVSELAKRAAAILRDGGHAESPDAMRRVTTNLESLAAWGRSNAGAQAGRLTADLEPLGFDGLAALLGGQQLEPAKVLQFRRATKEKQTEEDAAAARARAKEAIKAAERALTEARRDAEHAEAELAKAGARAQELEKQKQEMETRLRKAEEEARAASHEAKKRAQAVAEAERALNRARAALS